MILQNKQCKRCLLTEHKPDIWLDNDGICNICINFDKEKKISASGEKKPLLESDLIKILKKYQGKGKYDCLVMCSGGKDSTMALYYMKERYKMNPLAFTFDNGFESNEAISNIKNAVDILKVDWVYHKTDFMNDAFALIIKTKSKVPICHICTIWHIQLVYEFAAKYKIPLIIAGWTKGQSTQGKESGTEYAEMSKATYDFINNILRKISKYKKIPRSVNEALKTSRKKFKSVMISPHWYLEWEQEKNIKILNDKLKWKVPELSYPFGSTNCMMNFPSTYLTMKHYGYTHYHIEMSKQIRLGETTKEQSLKDLEINFDKKIVNDVLKKIECEI